MTPGTFKEFSLKLCPTPRSALVADFTANYDGRTPTVVYYDPAFTPSPVPYTWYGFDLQTPFYYNGVDNLIMEVRWKGRDGTPSFVTYWSRATARCVMSVGAAEPPLVYDFIHYMRITYDDTAVGPASLGRVKALWR